MHRPSSRQRLDPWSRLVVGVALALTWLLPRPALAWIETEVRSHLATVTVQPDGAAEVRHELVLRVRGGPLESLDIEGVGQGAEPLGDGTVRKATAGAGQVWPLALELREDGTVSLRIDAERGLRSGVYNFDFGYRVDLPSRGWLERKGGQARVTWVQPRFSGGIDSARVVFRLPRTASMPALPSEEGAATAVLLSEVRRGAEFDEVELVRAHVARGEAALWQVEVSASTFPFLGGSDAPQANAAPVGPLAPRALLLPPTPWWVWAMGGLVGLLYLLVLVAKWRAVRRNCERAGVQPRGLVPLPAGPRLLLAALLASAAAALGCADWPTLAGACLALGLLLAAWLPPVRPTKARGPGEWVQLEPADVAARTAPPVSGGWLDAGRAPGAFLLVALVFGTAFAAWAVLPASPYHAGLLLVSATLWLPVFLTGKMGDMPADAAFGALPLYRWVAGKLQRQGGVGVEYWGRRPLGVQHSAGTAQSLGALQSQVTAASAQFDEIRLRIQWSRQTPGLRLVEIGVEISGGLVATPCVVVRVDDGSAAYQAMPRSIQWVRGRRSQERVAILRPRFPSWSQCLQLALNVRRLLTLPTASTRPRADRGPERETLVQRPASATGA